MRYNIEGVGFVLSLLICGVRIIVVSVFHWILPHVAFSLVADACKVMRCTAIVAVLAPSRTCCVALSFAVRFAAPSASKILEALFVLKPIDSRFLQVIVLAFVI